MPEFFHFHDNFFQENYIVLFFQKDKDELKVKIIFNSSSRSE